LPEGKQAAAGRGCEPPGFCWLASCPGWLCLSGRTDPGPAGARRAVMARVSCPRRGGCWSEGICRAVRC